MHQFGGVRRHLEASSPRGKDLLLTHSHRPWDTWKQATGSACPDWRLTANCPHGGNGRGQPLQLHTRSLVDPQNPKITSSEGRNNPLNIRGVSGQPATNAHNPSPDHKRPKDDPLLMQGKTIPDPLQPYPQVQASLATGVLRASKGSICEEEGVI